MRSLRLALAGLLAALGLVALVDAPAQACSCVTAKPARLLSWSDAVFTGTLSAIEPPPQRDVMSSADPNTYTFDVGTVYEGDLGGEAAVKSAMSGASCGLERMDVGTEYLVFATVSDGELWSGLCSGTQPVRRAPVDRIAELAGPPQVVWSLPRDWLRIVAF